MSGNSLHGLSDPVPVPKWLFVGVMVPLILMAVTNGVRTYYGQKALNTSVKQLNLTVASLGDTVESLPRKSDVEAKYNFLIYRMDKLESRVGANTGRIAKNRDAINRLRSADNATWYPPMRWPANDQGIGLRLVLDGWLDGHA